MRLASRANRNGARNGGTGHQTGADHGTCGAHGELRHRSDHERYSPGVVLLSAAIATPNSKAATMPTLCWSKAGSGALTLGQPTSPGVPADFRENMALTRGTYNDLASVRAVGV